MADTNINTVTSRPAAAGDFAFVSGSSGVGPARVPLSATVAAALNAADSAALRVAADAASSAQGATADTALQPGPNLTQAKVNSATPAGANLLSQLVYSGDFASRPTSGLTAGQMAVFTGTIGGYYWQGLFAWNGAAWRPMHPTTIYSSNPASPYTGVNSTTALQGLLVQQFPPGIFMACRGFSVNMLHGKSGTGTTSNHNILMGSSGTISDASLSTTSTISTASSRSIASIVSVDVLSNVLVQGSSHPHGITATQTALQIPRSVAVSDLSAASYLSVYSSVAATGSDAPQLGAVSVTLY